MRELALTAEFDRYRGITLPRALYRLITLITHLDDNRTDPDHCV